MHTCFVAYLGVPMLTARSAAWTRPSADSDFGASVILVVCQPTWHGVLEVIPVALHGGSTVACSKDD